jgi:hypothetical protein
MRIGAMRSQGGFLSFPISCLTVIVLHPLTPGYTYKCDRRPIRLMLLLQAFACEFSLIDGSLLLALPVTVPALRAARAEEF